jgi:protein gp37
MQNTKIEWTENTWNPVAGCDKISPGCDNCYAMEIAERFRGRPAFPNGFHLTLHPERLDQPMRWKKPRRIFVCSMADLFHKEVPHEFIGQVFDVMERAHWHQFQVLTKRSSLMRDLMLERYADRAPPPNVWAGVSVEDVQRQSRIDHLRETPAAVRFLSVEPLLASVGELNLRGIDWVICGGESGRADSGDVACSFRDHVARCSDMMSPA